MTQERLQKIISKAQACSRRNAEELIKQSRVLVNGKAAIIGDRANEKQDEILIDGQQIVIHEESRVFLINKPIGYICSCKDPYGRPILTSLIPTNLRKGLHPVGRLDLNSRYMTRIPRRLH